MIARSMEARSLGQPLTLGAARQLAATLNRERARGTDLVADRRAEKRRQRIESADRGERSFEALARKFIESHRTKKHRTRPRRWGETAGLLGLFYEANDAPKRADYTNAGPSAMCAQLTNTTSGVWSRKRAKLVCPGALDGTKAFPSRARAMFSALFVLFRWLRRERDQAYFDLPPRDCSPRREVAFHQRSSLLRVCSQGFWRSGVHFTPPSP